MYADNFLAEPQWRRLDVTADGRVIATIARPDEHRARYVSTLWELGGAQLTGEQSAYAGSTERGDLLYTAAGELRVRRPDGADRVLAAPPGGAIGAVHRGGRIVFGTGMLPESADLADDAERRARRRAAGVTAIVYDDFPIQYWDHDLGPDRLRLVTGELTEDVLAGRAGLELRDLTGHVGRALGDECSWDLAPDGRTLISAWLVAEPGGSQRHTLVAIDVGTGSRRTLADSPDHEYRQPVFAPDGRTAAVLVDRRLTREQPGRSWLGLAGLDGGVRDLTADWDRWPLEARWLPDGSGLLVTADHDGRRPLWRVDATTGTVNRLTRDHGCYQSISLSGNEIYARRSAVDSPALPVRVSPDGAVERLAEPFAVPGRRTEIRIDARDGTPVRGWLLLPAAADGPVPLVVWLHGGPTQSANGWGWTWNPWPVVAAGYAVLLPDFAMSTGYGQEFVRRGWGRYGAEPYTDVLDLTGAACCLPEIDGDRAAVVGTSFGGYLANWIAGRTDRFRAIVSQAAPWQLDLIGESDLAHFFAREMSPAAADAHSPHHAADAIRTPMLVVHGGRDRRVPISEARRLWWDLMSRGPGEHRFLYFPEEGHFITRPSALGVWYETVLTFFATHLAPVIHRS